MSIIVRDMEMPRGCVDCHFRWPGDSTTYCLAQPEPYDWHGTTMYRLHHIDNGHRGSMAYDWKEDTCPLEEYRDSVEPTEVCE